MGPRGVENPPHSSLPPPRPPDPSQFKLKIQAHREEVAARFNKLGQSLTAFTAEQEEFQRELREELRQLRLSYGEPSLPQPHSNPPTTTVSAPPPSSSAGTPSSPSYCQSQLLKCQLPQPPSFQSRSDMREPATGYGSGVYDEPQPQFPDPTPPASFTLTQAVANLTHTHIVTATTPPQSLPQIHHSPNVKPHKLKFKFGRVHRKVRIQSLVTLKRTISNLPRPMASHGCSSKSGKEASSSSSKSRCRKKSDDSESDSYTGSGDSDGPDSSPMRSSGKRKEQSNHRKNSCWKKSDDESYENDDLKKKRSSKNVNKEQVAEYLASGDSKSIWANHRVKYPRCNSQKQFLGRYYHCDYGPIIFVSEICGSKKCGSVSSIILCFSVGYEWSRGGRKLNLKHKCANQDYNEAFEIMLRVILQGCSVLSAIDSNVSAFSHLVFMSNRRFKVVMLMFSKPGEHFVATVLLNKMEREGNIFAAFAFLVKDSVGCIKNGELEQSCKEFGHICDERVKEVYQGAFNNYLNTLKGSVGFSWVPIYESLEGWLGSYFASMVTAVEQSAIFISKQESTLKQMDSLGLGTDVGTLISIHANFNMFVSVMAHRNLELDALMNVLSSLRKCKKIRPYYSSNEAKVAGLHTGLHIIVPYSIYWNDSMLEEHDKELRTYYLHCVANNIAIRSEMFKFLHNGVLLLLAMLFTNNETLHQLREYNALALCILEKLYESMLIEGAQKLMIIRAQRWPPTLYQGMMLCKSLDQDEIILLSLMSANSCLEASLVISNGVFEVILTSRDSLGEEDSNHAWLYFILKLGLILGLVVHTSRMQPDHENVIGSNRNQFYNPHWGVTWVRVVYICNQPSSSSIEIIGFLLVNFDSLPEQHHNCLKVACDLEGMMLFDEDGPMPNTQTVHEVDCQLQDRNSFLALLKQNVHKAQERMKLLRDKRHTEKTFEVDDLVYLKWQSYKQPSVEKRTVHKLLAKYHDLSEEIERIGMVAYKLKLPASARTHPAKVIDTMLVKRKGRASAKWLIQWIGTPVEDATGEFAEDIMARYPDLNLEEEVLQLKLEDKLFFKAGRVVRDQNYWTNTD